MKRLLRPKQESRTEAQYLFYVNTNNVLGNFLNALRKHGKSFLIWKTKISANIMLIYSLGSPKSHGFVEVLKGERHFYATVMRFKSAK